MLWGRLLVPLDQNLFGWFLSRGEARVLNAAAIEVAVPLPPVHSEEPGAGPEGFENGLVTAHLGVYVDGVVRSGPGPWADASADRTFLKPTSVKMTGLPVFWCSRAMLSAMVAA